MATITYKVKKGDTLSSLGLPQEILKLNPGLSSLKVGQTIRVPTNFFNQQAAGSGMVLDANGVRSGGKPGQGGNTGGQVNTGFGPNTDRRNGGPTPNDSPYNTTQAPRGGFLNGAGGPPGFGKGNGTPGQYGGINPGANTGFQSGANILPGNQYQNGSPIIPRGESGTKTSGPNWIDFKTIPPGMTWVEYNTRLQLAQQEGYNGPFLSPDANGVGVLGWGPGRPLQQGGGNTGGQVSNGMQSGGSIIPGQNGNPLKGNTGFQNGSNIIPGQNGNPIKGGNGTTSYTTNVGGVSNISTVNSKSPRRSQNSVLNNPNQLGNMGDTSWLDNLIAQNPQLGQFRDLLLQGMGQSGNTGGNNAVNQSMNWRF